MNVLSLTGGENDPQRPSYLLQPCFSIMPISSSVSPYNSYTSASIWRSVGRAFGKLTPGLPLIALHFQTAGALSCATGTVK
jgi:hypothetical protein